MDDSGDIIKGGDYVIVKKTFEDSYRLTKVGKDRRCYFGKQRLEIGAIIGHKFGSTFELTKNFQLNLMDDNQISINIDRDTETHRDNRNVTDNNESQKLTRDDIEALKKENLGSHELIKTIVENSTTFESKNKHSQDKYLAKKQIKHMSCFTMMRPTARHLMEMYYASGPGKNCHIRIDTLAQMLHLANIMYGAKYVVVDTNLGLISAACFERMGGNGRIIQFTLEEQTHAGMRQAIEALNFPSDVVSSSVSSLSIYDLVDTLLIENLPQNHSQTSEEAQTEDNIEEDIEGDDVSRQNEKETSDEKRKHSLASQEARRKARIEDIKKSKALLEEKDMDGLLIVTEEHHPKSIIDLLYVYLANSRPFVIYCSIVEPLIEVYNSMKNNALYLKISQTWLREYQVMDARTRPDMMMEGSSGFLLTGFKIAE